MNVTIEAGVMTAEATAVAAVVRVISKVGTFVTALITQTPASFVRLLRQGRSSLSAVPGDTNFLKGDYAVFA